MTTDPISDLFSTLRNATVAGHGVVTVPHSSLKEHIVRIFKKNHYVLDYKVEGDVKKTLVIELDASKNRNIPTYRRISTPGHRVFVASQAIKKSRNGTGIFLISTSKGVITGYEARSLNVGGEVLGEVYV
jgi:small subunit ribosomal protein S8